MAEIIIGHQAIIDSLDMEEEPRNKFQPLKESMKENAPGFYEAVALEAYGASKLRGESESDEFVQEMGRFGNTLCLGLAPLFFANGEVFPEIPKFTVEELLDEFGPDDKMNPHDVPRLPDPADSIVEFFRQMKEFGKYFTTRLNDKKLHSFSRYMIAILLLAAYKHCNPKFELG